MVKAYCTKLYYKAKEMGSLQDTYQCEWDVVEGNEDPGTKIENVTAKMDLHVVVVLGSDKNLPIRA